jgi:hypothetical protein
MADRNFERALRSAARRGRTAGVCPDAATLAAYVDRSLSAQEHTTIEAHVADCRACLEHLALVAALDAPEESQVPTPAFDLGALVRKWGWLVPAMTAGLVVAVWLRSSDRRPANASLPAPSRAADQAPAEPRPDTPTVDQYASLKGASELQAKRDVPAASGGKKTGLPARPATPASAMADAAKPASPSLPAEAESDNAKQMADRAGANEKNKERAQTPGFAAAAPPPAATASPATAVDTREEASAKVAPEPTLLGGAASGRMRKAVRQESAATAGTVLVRTTFGRIDRSTDGGQSWTNEHGDLTDRIRVTLCPTATACWLGAESGAVFVRTPDGQWVRRVVPPPAAAVQRIVALDNQHATIELSDGRRFVTTNGGITWTAPPTEP